MLANVRVHFSKGKKKQARHKPNNQHLSNPPFASHLPVSSLQNSGRRPAMAPRYRVDIADHFPGINATLSSPPPPVIMVMSALYVSARTFVETVEKADSN